MLSMNMPSTRAEPIDAAGSGEVDEARQSPRMSLPAWRVSVAPMMGYTDRHFRYLLRLISPNTALYTEMVTANALLHRGPGIIALDEGQGHTALQLGGSEPDDLARCAALAEAEGYTELNLNVGCPSPRVSKGRFGACLMAEPTLVAECVAAMRSASRLPVTVKCRLGIDAFDDDPFLHRFVDAVRPHIDGLVVHARIALLEGLSPEENREIPPLQYPRVHALRERCPTLPVAINGGIRSMDDARRELALNDGVMLGRAICANPSLLGELDAQFLGGPRTDDAVVLDGYVDYMHRELERGTPFTAMARRTLGLFTGVPGARRFRREVTVLCHEGCRDPERIRAAGARLPMDPAAA